MPDIDPEDLKKNDGKDGRPAWVLHEGKVYDVSGSKLWKSGAHMRRHQAGGDLTDALGAAPHGAEVFGKVPELGALAGSPSRVVPSPTGAGSEGPLEGFLRRVPFLRRHPHPLMVHFPIALIYVGLVFAVLFILFEREDFAHASRYMILSGILSAPLGILSGAWNWWVAFGLAPVSQVKIKIGLSALFLVAGGITAAWWLTTPALLTNLDTNSHLLLALLAVQALLVSGLGYLGAALTIPHE